MKGIQSILLLGIIGRDRDFLTKGLLKEEISNLIIEGQKSKGKTFTENSEPKDQQRERGYCALGTERPL